MVGYEALAWGRHVNDHRDAWAIMEAVGARMRVKSRFTRAATTEDFCAATSARAPRALDSALSRSCLLTAFMPMRLRYRSACNRDEALTHEMLAEAHRNPQVAASISDFCVKYREIFGELAKLAQPSLGGHELEGAAELLLACLFGLGHRQLTSPKLDEATTAKVTTRLILQALGVH